MKNTLSIIIEFILIAFLAITFAIFIAWMLGVFEGTKLPIEKIDFSPEYEIPWTDSEGKG